MTSTIVFWVTAIVLYVAYLFVDHVTESMREAARKRRHDKAVKHNLQHFADTLGIDRRHVFLDSLGRIDITEEGQEDHARNLGLRMQRIDDRVTRYVPIDRMDA